MLRAQAFLAAAVVTATLIAVTVSLGPAPLPRWRITHRVAAHLALVLEVEAGHPEEALAIARSIRESERGRFGEMLVFINSRGQHDMLRRVQWTEQHGYVETVYPR